jgi:transmembrane sensor
MNNALKAATEWYAKLNADSVSEAEQRAFQDWKQASEDNRAAWGRVESVAQQFDGIEPVISKATLLRPAERPISPERRRLLKQLGVVAVVGSIGWTGYRHQPWQTMLADYATSTGEQRDIQLADGSRVVLNTDSAIDIVYNEQSRTIVLLKGEILIETGRGSGSHLPFILKTRQGQVRALGTRFSVRDRGRFSTVSVFEGAVAITPASQSIERLRLNAGETATFGSEQVSAASPLPPGSDIWIKGIISVANMPLKDFVAELDRYHRGILRCDPAVENLAVSGAFPVRDIEAVLAGLVRTYPVRVETRTRYWVTLKPI